jgi:hypothetical protein
MATVFEYIINVPTRDIDAAKKKLSELQDTAQSGLKTLNQGFVTVGETVKQNIKDYGVLGAAGKGAITGLSAGFKSLTSVTKTLGTVLKANPLFTLVGILLPIIDAIKDVILNLGIVQLYFELVGNAIQFVIGLLKDFLDLLGLTTFAEDEAAQKAIALAEERKQVNDILYTSMLRDMEREIALLQAQGAEIEVIEDKQLELARVRSATAAQALKDEQSILEAKIRTALVEGIFLVEETKRLEELKNTAKDTENSVKILEAQIATARKNRSDKEIADTKRTEDEKNRLRKEAALKRAADEKVFATARERAARQIEDLATAAIVDQTERELEQNRIKFERLIADTQANQTLLESEKVKIIQAFAAQQETADAAIREKKRLADLDIENKKIEDRKKLEREFLDFALQQAENETAIKIQQVNDEFAERAQKLQEFLTAGLITQEEFNQRELLLAQQQAKALEEIEKERLQKEIDANFAALQEKVKFSRIASQSINSLAESVFEVANNLGRQDEEAAQRRAKRQFNIAKALNIVEAAINGSQAITKAIALFGPPPSPLGVAGITQAGVITAAQIAAIASRRFDPGQTSETAIPLPPVSEPIAPRFELFGRPGATDLQAPESRDVSQPRTLRAVVSETDLQDTTLRLRTIRQQSEL